MLMIMRRALTIIGVTLLTLATAVIAQAQQPELAFRGSDVLQLARVIASEARRANQLPTAYRLPATSGKDAVVTAANVYELLARTTYSWYAEHIFPGTVPLTLLDVAQPAADPSLEPLRDGLQITIPSTDIGTYSQAWLAMVEAPGHKIPRAMKLGTTTATSYRLTAAQTVVAMAVLFDEAAKVGPQGKIPANITIPLVRTPLNWTDTRTPVPVYGQRTSAGTEENPVTHIEINTDLRVSLNAFELSERGPVAVRGPLPPFCGPISVELAGFGPVKAIRLLIDGQEYAQFSGIGPHRNTINTLTLTDGAHTISASTTDESGKAKAYVFSFTVRNGRVSSFTPAEREERVIDAQPGREAIIDAGP